jgi:LPS O-antigen subunit length determinant protein (WzzB/FepE family)
MDELECSSIEAANNQSSFISSMGKEALMRQLEEEREKSTLDPGNKMVNRLKNHRKLKNVFPDGFF